MMKLCSRCGKRVAVVFVTRSENGRTTNEGLCLKCARDVGLPNIDAIMKNMHISEEDLDRMEDEMADFNAALADNNEDTSSNIVPPIDISKIMENFPFQMPNGIMPNGMIPNGNNNPNEGGKEQNPQLPSHPPRRSEPKNGEQKGSSQDGQKGEGGKSKKYLSQYCQDITRKAAEGKIDKIIGRDRELSRLIQILSRRQKNNPCLIGEPGVGKTAIAEALALKINAHDVPYKLENKEVHLVDLTALVAGTQFRGQFEQRIKSLIDEVKSLGNIILVIDEVHSIVGAGDAEGGMNAANILKPALSRGEIQVIGATTLAEYRKYIEKDAALERRFQPIIVEEPSIDDSMQIILGIKGYYENYHGIKVPDEVARQTVVLSERYITDRFLPDKAIDLLDEASAYLVMHTPIISEIGRKSDELIAAAKERERLENNLQNDPNLTDEAREKLFGEVAEAKTHELSLKNTLEKLRVEREGVTLSMEDLAKVIEIWTAIPAASITQAEFTRVAGLRERLRARIVGQDDAIDAVVRAIKRSRAGISYKRKPVSFIFAGPTGVGKTELVKTVAADLFDAPETLIRLDMSEFMEKHSVSRIIGSPPGYVGYDEAGQLTEKIRRKPYSVVLFDEIEKAHPDVMNILLQILDDGRITDAQGRTVNFENTIIVMTTNAGSDINSSGGALGFNSSERKAADDKTMRALQDFLRPEFLNRVDEIITFRSLDRDNFTAIARIMLDDLVGVLAAKGIKVAYNDEAAAYIAEHSFDTKFGARNMRRYIQKHVEDIIAENIISGYADGVTMVGIGVKDGALEILCR